MADLKKFLDQAGVSTLWTRIAEEVAKEKTRAEAAEAANAAAAKKAQDEVDALETYVGTIPEGYSESNIVAYIKKVAAETLASANGGSNESAASVKAALDAYVAENNPKVQANADAIDAIEADYLVEADKTELANSIQANANEITRIDNALKAAIENEGEGLDSIKELATWIEAHGTEAAGYAAAIDALELLVGDKAVATQIAEAIAAENLGQYALDSDLDAAVERVGALEGKVDTTGTVTEAINAAIAALAIGDYAKAADLTALATRVSTAEGKIANLEAEDIAIKGRLDAIEAKVPTWNAAEANAKAYADGLAVNYDAAGAAAQALTDAKAYTDSEINTKVIALTSAEIDAAIASAKA